MTRSASGASGVRAATAGSARNGLPARLLPDLARAAAALRAGEVVAYPTEAVYGLGCDPWNRAAFETLLGIKGRALAKGVILIAASFVQARRVLDPRFAHLWAEPRSTWPGPVTWVLPARPGLPRWITGGRASVAVRVTDHAFSAALCRRFGAPLVSTSANRSGAPPCRDAVSVRNRLGAGIAVIVNAPLGGRAGPSAIRDARSGAWLRRG